MVLDPGLYHTRELANGIIFVRATVAECNEYRDALELDGFPIPASLRVTGFDKSLTAFWHRAWTFASHVQGWIRHLGNDVIVATWCITFESRRVWCACFAFVGQ